MFRRFTSVPNALIVLLLAAGCATIQPRQVLVATYETALVEVARPAATMERWGAVTTITLSDSSRYHYEDKLIEVRMAAAYDRVWFAMSNKTDHSIKLIWDEVSFIDLDGQLSRVMHQGVKYADRNASQPASIIPARQTLTDVVLPNNRVTFDEGYYGVYYTRRAEWRHALLIQPSYEFVDVSPSGTPLTDGADFRRRAEAMVGKRFGILIPLEIQGVVNEYTFWFEVTGVSVKGPDAIETVMRDV